MSRHYSFLPASRFVALGALLLLAVAPAQATYKKLYSFSATYTDGFYPVGAPLFSGTSMYGFTSGSNGGYGSFYKQSTSGGVTTVKNFDGSDMVITPNAGPVQGSGSTLYATCLYGGANNYGMVFSITTAGAVTELFSFTANNATDGYHPYGAPILASDGKLYGTAYYGGTTNEGIIWKVDPASHAFGIVHSFSSAAGEGYNPFTAVCEGSDGKLYGVSYYGGANGYGTIYRLDKNGGNFQVLHDCNVGDSIGAYPYADLMKGPGTFSGKLYGTCRTGGDYGYGTVFCIDTATGSVTAGASFDGYTGAYPGNAFGNSPQARLVAQPGSSATLLYGTTMAGGPTGYGAAFKFDAGAHAITLLSGLSQQIGCGSCTPFAISGANLYASSYFGGIAATLNAGDGYGGSFSCATATGALKLTHSWYMLDGYFPYGCVTAPVSGAMYGTASGGGNFNSGFIYKITTGGTLTVLHHFNNYLMEGATPTAGLLRASDGSLYGTTSGGGAYGAGTIFKCTTSGAFTILHHIRYYEGSNCYARLAQGLGTDSKSLYGCFYYNGAGNAGTVWKMDTAGKTFTVLHYFMGTDGAYPDTQLAVEPDGSGNTAAVYGGTAGGGTGYSGVLFKIVQNPKPAAPTYTIVHGFTGPEGIQMIVSGMRIITGSPNVLYGVAYSGGANSNGTLFRVSLTGAYPLTVLHHFDNAAGEGYQPIGDITFDSGNANIVGACQYGGSGSGGTVWKYNVAGNSLTVLHSLATTAVGGDGNNNYGVVYDVPNGMIYGVSAYGGDHDYGLIYSQTIAP